MKIFSTAMSTTVREGQAQKNKGPESKEYTYIVQKSAQNEKGTFAIRCQDYYGIAGTRSLVSLFLEVFPRMTAKEAARALKDIIDNAHGVELENLADAFSNVCRFLEEPSDKKLGPRTKTATFLGRVFDQLHRTSPATLERLTRTFSARLGLEDQLKTLITEAQFQELEESRLTALRR